MPRVWHFSAFHFFSHKTWTANWDTGSNIANECYAHLFRSIYYCTTNPGGCMAVCKPQHHLLHKSYITCSCEMIKSLAWFQYHNLFCSHLLQTEWCTVQSVKVYFQSKSHCNLHVCVWRGSGVLSDIFVTGNEATLKFESSDQIAEGIR